MRLTILVLLFAFSGCAQRPAATAEAKLKAAEQLERLARLESLVLREQIAAQQLEKVRADQQRLYVETCQAAGLEPGAKTCLVDLNATPKSVSKPPADKAAK